MSCEPERKVVRLLGTAFLMTACAMPSTAFAQGVLLDDDDDEPEGVAEPEVDSGLTAAPKADWGIGVRLRNVLIPQWIFESVFVEDVPAAISHFGFGVEGVRRKGDLEMSLGIEYESLEMKEGLWLDKGDEIPNDEVDKVEFEDFSWVTVDATFIWHTRLHKMVALRYGAGIGLGIIRGKVLRTDYICPGTDLAEPPCQIKPSAEHIRDEEDKIPPVFPVLNAVIGAQFRPADNVSINVEAGLRTVLYYGLTGTFFF